MGIGRGDGDFDGILQVVFKNVIGFFYLVQRETVGDERRGVDLPVGDETENLSAVAAVHAAGLEGQVFAVHVGKGKHLGTVVEGNNGHYGVGAGAFPSKAEGALCPGNLEYGVGSSVCAFPEDGGAAFFRSGDENVGVVLADEAAAFGGFFADNEAARMFQPGAKEGANPCRSGADDENGVVGSDFSDACSPIAGGEDVAGKESLFVSNIGWNGGKPLVGMGHTDVFRLAAVDAATECPAAVRSGAVVDVTVAAEEAFAAESLDVDCHAVAGADVADLAARGFDDAHHFMPDGDAGHGAGHAAVLDVEVAGADAGEGDAHDGVAGILEDRLRFFQEGKLALFNVGIC